MKDSLLSNPNICYNSIKGVEFVQFSNLKKYDDLIRHGFTTRIGGVSTGECCSLNLGFNRKDTRENVEENYRRVAQALNIKVENMVFSNQVHDNKIRIVNEEDRGKGIIFESDIIGFDGLVTNKREVALVTFYADCVPVFFFDPVKRVTAASHSGWRGTVKRISSVTLDMMNSQFKTNKEDVEIAIGPSIGKCCFEVGSEVYREFRNEFSWIDEYASEKINGKYYLNLQGIIKKTLIASGAVEDKICLSNVCTKCNKDIFYSHRGDCGKTGSLAGIIQLI
ncbi:MAG: peptidoglycan editing factor PgeF [Bacillota bacterium]|nr:peptidoglycan editing factor PgeF [Bacillota bacterium]